MNSPQRGSQVCAQEHLGVSVPDRQLDCLVDKMEEKTNLHNGAIDHCHNKQPAVAWREYVFRRRSPGERVFVDTRLLRIW